MFFWTQPVALGILIVLIVLTACTGHAMVSHWLRTSLERRKLSELKRYNDRQDKIDHSLAATSKAHHPASPGPQMSPRVVASPFVPRYPAPPGFSQANMRREDLVATVIDINDYQTDPVRQHM